MQILTAAEMGEADRRTVAEAGVPFAELMEQAGAAVARFCLRQYPDAGEVLVLCGKGNNGGDGMVAARVLSRSGRTVRVLLLGAEEGVHGQAAEALRRLRNEAPDVVIESVDEQTVGAQAHRIAGADLLLDAVVGTGFKPPLRGTAAALRELVNQVTVPVVAVDLPSGWSADATSQHADGSSGAESNPPQLRAEAAAHGAFRADAVVTFTAPKLAHVFGHLTPGRSFGPVAVAKIGSPETAIRSDLRLTWTGASKSLTELPRNIDSNKGRFGHLLIAAGSYGKAGAPSMASLAALRAGAGLVTTAVPKSILNTVARIAPELMTAALKEDAAGSAALRNLDPKPLERLIKGIDVLALGPGLSTEGEASEFARGMVERTSIPVVIDADGLNAYAGRPELLKGVSGKGMDRGELRTVVLTPHPGEMARLIGTTISAVQANRLDLARSFATAHGVTLVLKGWRTLVAHPDGRVAVNTSGNPGLAKGGSGDILTGIVGAMLAQFPHDVPAAVEAAVFLHGLAADLAVAGPGAGAGHDEHTLLATDVVSHLWEAFRYRVVDRDGLAWLAGLNL